MRFPHLCLLVLPFALAGCRSVVTAQAAPDTKGAESPLKGADTAASSTRVSDGLAVSISCIQSSTVYPGSKSQQPGILTFFLPEDPHIDVVLRNISAQPISIHQEWNSWGYSNLSLEISKIDGKTLPKPILVQREGGTWFRNFPEAQTIAPGEAIVREVHFPHAKGMEKTAPIRGGSYYSPFPFKSGSSPVYTLRAVFQNSSGDRQQYASSVWTGKVASPPRDYIFR